MFSYFDEYSWQRDILIVGGAVFIFAFIGPFGTFNDMPFAVRLLFWTIAVFGCGAIFWVVVFLTSHLGFFKNLPAFVHHVATVFITAFPASVLIYYNNIIFRDIAFAPQEWPWLYSTVFIIGMIITSLHFFSLFGKSLSQKKSDQEKISKILIKTDKNILRFMDRLPNNLGTELISISSHDHYIDVCTSKGTEMIYMKFSNAVKELANYPGMQIHRSHWVADSAIKKINPNGRSKSLRLTNGNSLPISKKYQANLEDLL